MIIREIDSDSIEDQIAALSVFLLGRAEDEGATKTISVDAFIELASNMGISLSRAQLIDLATKPPLDNLIQAVDDTNVVFKGGPAEVNANMTVDKARETVKKMANRANPIT